MTTITDHEDTTGGDVDAALAGTARTQPDAGEPKVQRLLDELSPPLPVLLTSALAELSHLGVAEKFDGADDHADRLRSLVELIASTEGLRTLLRATGPLLSGPEATLAAELLSPDAATAARASERVRAQVTAAVAEQRRARRHANRARKAPAPERAQARAERDIDKVRESRDMHRGRAERLADENARLRADLESRIEAEAESAEREASVRMQLHTLRGRAGDVAWLSGLLSELLDTSLVKAAHPAEARTADAFAVLDQAPLLEAVNATLTSAPAPVANPEDSTAPEGALRRALRQMLRSLSAPAPAIVSENALRVDVLGGGTEIGGSCVLVEAAGTRILVDCGARPQGASAETTRPRRYADALAGRIDAVVITHAHNDHAGWVPALLAERPGTPVYATPATCDLLVPMWHDSAKVMRRNGMDAYGRADVEAAIDAFRETHFNSPTTIGNLTVELGRAGHIVGAASVAVSAGERRVVISGDVSGSGQESVGGFVPSPASMGADLLLLESTYAADDAHAHRGQVVKEFLRTVNDTYERGGVALVPAFALGRAQEVALILSRYAPDVPVLIDGLARDVTDVYEQHAGVDGAGRRIFSDQVRRVPAGGTARAIEQFKAGVVISTSGMLNQGPAVAWAHRVLPDPKSSLMVVGYQDGESPGSKLLRLAENGGGEFTLPSRDDEQPAPVLVRAHVDRYQLGAHASSNDLAGIVASTQPQRLMLVHGEARGQSKFAARMRARAQTVVPTGEWRPTT